ncbi:MAG: hypothetical protein CMN76_18860 [Spirochaetaceae bacterium]|nr:hypothetical protein [Spirochaetaceae bacterium]
MSHNPSRYSGNDGPGAEGEKTLELDQKIFQKLYRVFSKPLHIEELDLERFRIFAGLLSSEALNLSIVGDHGGYRDSEVMLPSISYLVSRSKVFRKEIQKKGWESVHPTLAEFYLYRILQACLKMNLFPEDPRVLRNQEEKGRLSLAFLSRYGLEDLLDGRRIPGESRAGASIEEIEKAVTARQSEKNIHMDSRIDSVQENKKKVQDYTLNHSFEKIETLEEFQGNWREMDGADQIEEMNDALNELQFNQVIRTEESAEGFLKSDHAGFASEILGETRGPFLYPEWDYKKKKFKNDHCSVTELEPLSASANSVSEVLEKHHQTLFKLKHDLNRILNRFSPEPRQVQGDEIDLDAAVDYLVDRSIGHTPSERLYRKRRRNIREIDLLLLLDNSLSTDSYRNGIRVLDAERDAMLLFGEALSDAGLPFACYSFYSKTRHNCQVQKLHGFDESWSRSRGRLLNLEPRGYTRIGPALRHASSILEQRAGRHRWIVLFTDGHPNDYDRYEGRYGQEDVKHAIQEAESDGMGVYLLSFDRSRDVFGGYAESALNLKRMPELLMSFYSRVAGN